MTYTLRPHQVKGVEDIREQIRSGAKRVLYVLPTGGGKTLLFVKGIIEPAVARGKKCWIIVPKLALIEQTLEKLDQLGIPAGVIQANHHRTNLSKPVQVCSKDSLVPRLKKGMKIDPPDIIIADEAHHWTDQNEYGWIVQRYPDSILIGPTATPCRLDGRGLGRVFERIVIGPSINWLMQNEFLIPVIYYSHASPAPKFRKASTGDFVNADIDEWARQEKVVGDAVAEYQLNAAGRRAIGFAPSVASAEYISNRFRDAGVPSAFIVADTKPQERKRLIADLKTGQLKNLMSVGVFTEGFDCPAVDCLMMLRPTLSLQLYIQMAGRGIRPEHGIARPGEHCVILDHCGFVHDPKFGPITNDREWSLEDGVKMEQSERVYECPHCDFELKSWPIMCPSCGNRLHPEDAEAHQKEIKLGNDDRLEKYDAEKQRQLEELQKKHRQELYKELESQGMLLGWSADEVNKRFKKLMGTYPTRIDKAQSMGMIVTRPARDGGWESVWKHELAKNYGMAGHD
jgi:DNA repair protein RadD